MKSPIPSLLCNKGPFIKRLKLFSLWKDSVSDMQSLAFSSSMTPITCVANEICAMQSDEGYRQAPINLYILTKPSLLAARNLLPVLYKDK